MKHAKSEPKRNWKKPLAVLAAAAFVMAGGGAFLASMSPVEAATPPPIASPDVTYGPVVSITQGGTYSPSSIGVDIKTTQPVILENCYVKSSTRSLVQMSVGGANVTIRNCRFEGSAIPGNAGYRGVWGLGVNSLRVENNDFLHIAAVKVQGGNNPTVAILNNRVRDVIGDETNCCGGGLAPAFQIAELTSPNIEIAWNEVINTPGQSNMEDGVNLYGASGTVASPIRIHDNFFWGAYPLPITDGYSGGGILSGDGPNGGTNNIVVTDNQLVGTTNYGIQIGGGNNVKMERNRAVSSGLTASGQEIPAQNTNPFWTYSVAPTNSSMSNNVWAWMRGPNSRWPGNPPAWHRADSWMPACGTGGNVCTGNQSLTANPSERIYYAAEQAEYDRWVVKAAGKQIGKGNGPPATTVVPTTTTTVAPTTTTTLAPTTTTTVAPTTTTTAPPVETVPKSQYDALLAQHQALLAELAALQAKYGG